MILVVFLFLIILLLLIFLYRRRQTEQEEDDILFLTQKNAELQRRLDEQNQTLDDALDGTELDRQEIIEASRLECGFGLNSAGGCSGDMVLDEEGKCCTLKEGRRPTSVEIGLEIAAQLIQDIIIGEIVEKVVLEILPQATELIAQGIAKRAASRAIGRSAAKLAVVAARFSKIVASTGFSRGMLAFEIGSMALDIFDPVGYNLFIPNSETVKVRNMLESKFQASVPRDQWPYIFPISLVFPDEFRLAMAELTSDATPDALDAIMQSDAELFIEFLVSGISGETFDREEEFFTLFENKVSEAINANPRERDNKIYTKLIEVLLPTYRAWISKYTFLSNKQRIAVSLSRTGVREWNEFNEVRWRRWNPNREDAPPLFAVYKNTYRSVNRSDPGDASNPNMIEQRLPQHVALGYPYYPLIALCEDTKRARDGQGPSSVGGASVDPYSHGVRFNPETGVCNFTPGYCRRFQLEYNGSGNTSCGYYDGQEFAELVFGTTVTRGVMEAATQTKEFFENIF
jgi:hypothetical protein